MAGQVCMTAPTCVASHMEVEDSAVVTFCRRRADVFARILYWAQYVCLCLLAEVRANRAPGFLGPCCMLSGRRWHTGLGGHRALGGTQPTQPRVGHSQHS